jgi:hypothetical protein
LAERFAKKWTFLKSPIRLEILVSSEGLFISPEAAAMDAAGSNHPKRRDDPAPEEIELLAAEIRSRWSAEERQRRKTFARERQPARIPIIRLQDLLGESPL